MCCVTKCNQICFMLKRKKLKSIFLLFISNCSLRASVLHTYMQRNEKFLMREKNISSDNVHSVTSDGCANDHVLIRGSNKAAAESEALLYGSGRISRPH